MSIPLENSLVSFSSCIQAIVVFEKLFVTSLFHFQMLLHVAARGGHKEVCKLLLNRRVAILCNSDLSFLNQAGRTALTAAFRSGYFENVKCLIEHGADVFGANNVCSFYLIKLCPLSFYLFTCSFLCQCSISEIHSSSVFHHFKL